jgi:archaemetzincin
MKNLQAYLIVLLITCILLSCNEPTNTETIKKDRVSSTSYKLSQFLSLDTIQSKLGKPRPDEWLAFKDEKGQSFSEYIKSGPVTPCKKKNKIYILPIGAFTETDLFVINETAEFMHLFYNLEVVVQKGISASHIPNSAKRDFFDVTQLYTKYILYEILLKQIPDDAVVYTAITSNDLYPADDWNFVFGQASIKKRVAVSSIHRLRYPEPDMTNYQRFLKRIAKTCTHETAHMFGLLHCIEYKCLMNGSNHLIEADSKPMHLCPECLAKLTWCTKQNVLERYDRLIPFFDKHGYDEEVEFMNASKKIFKSTL